MEIRTCCACGLADHCNRSAASLGQEDWFTGGYERHELTGIGHFAQRESPTAIATLVKKIVVRTYCAGFGSGCPSGTGVPKCGVPSGFQVKGWMRGERILPQPSWGPGLA